MAGLLRSANPIITYGGKDVSADWVPAIMQLTWKRSIGDSTNRNADSITIQLADPTGYFRHNYNLKCKQTLRLQVESWNWRFPGEHLLSDATEMTISRVEIEGSKDRGSVITLTATSIPPISGFRLTKKSRSVVRTDFKTLCGKIAADNGLTLQYNTKINPQIAYAEQHDQSDAAFLQRIAIEHDLIFRPRNKTLIVGSMAELGKQAPVGTIVCPSPGNPGGINGNGIISYHLAEDIEDTYSAALSQSKDVATGKTVTGYATDKNNKEGPVHNTVHKPVTQTEKSESTDVIVEGE
jgi:hypothetical protein